MKIIQTSDTENYKSFAIFPYKTKFSRIEIEKTQDLKTKIWSPAKIKFPTIIPIDANKARLLSKAFDKAADLVDDLDKKYEKTI